MSRSRKRRRRTSKGRSSAGRRFAVEAAARGLGSPSSSSGRWIFELVTGGV